ncbi:MAG: hypothetical protein M3137_12845 [Actinomycetota bacterium]|nr:hypothetical protein [Actinomycetota bacterium]
MGPNQALARRLRGGGELPNIAFPTAAGRQEQRGREDESARQDVREEPPRDDNAEHKEGGELEKVRDPAAAVPVP